MTGLTKLDYEILDQLAAAPRTTNKAIAGALDISEPTVAARIRRMEDMRAMRILPLQDFTLEGDGALAILDIHVSGRALDAVVADLVALRETISVVVMSGTPTLVTSITAPDPLSLMRLVTDRIGQIAGVRSISTNYIPDILKWRVGFGRLLEDMALLAPPPGNKIDTLDSSILEQLMTDGRMSNREIARQVETSEHTVRQRIRKLEDAGLLRFTLIVDSDHAEFKAVAYVRIETIPSLTSEVAALACSLDSCLFVGSVLGRHDLILLLAAASRDALVGIISEEIAGHAGVDHYEVREPVGYAKNLIHRAALL